MREKVALRPVVKRELLVLVAVRVSGPLGGQFPELPDGDWLPQCGLNCVRGVPGEVPSTLDGHDRRTGPHDIGASVPQNH